MRYPDDSPRRILASTTVVANRTHALFFAPEGDSRDFNSVLKEVQEYISGKYSSLITDGGDEDAKSQIKRYITKYVQDQRIAVKGYSADGLVDALYTEMAEFGLLTKYIFGTGIEEININSWRDIEVLYSNGQMVKLDEHFDSPGHAINVIRRMLHVSGMVLDNASPAVLGHLSKNIRIAVLKTPLVDEDVGVTASIRIVNPQNMQKDDFVRGGTATGDMLDFLSACLRYGVSVCVAGATGSGKTTVAGWLLTTIPDNKRVFTIENGSRELDLVREKDGKVCMAGDFEESLDYGDIYGRLDALLNLTNQSGYHVQYTEDSKMEFRVWDLSVDLQNASFASADSAGNRLIADCEIELEVPVSFGGRLLPPMRMTVKVSAGYTPRF